ncbi:Hypothetical predicted protein [Mytilus galloprovincialis]|uniref:Endonuclease/exonuclease/phosphatase domain-containing protein n=1 Tax=Mytilus galloprovincialis TaxID=29158 RepID=A0A8B6EGA0_MYTGA|nr:Hypothetical predicted protein [Mytilus galloprovincialis]
MFDIHVLDEEEEGVLWLEFSAKLEKLCFCVAICYLPPADSCRPVDSDVFFRNLLHQIYSYQHKGKIFICGDFNSRVGSNSDYIEGVDLVKPRNYIDHTENHHGDVFINFLSDVNFGMLNGRFNDNQFTCISTTGKSVVDYICVPYEDMENIEDFKIVPMSDIINNISYIPDSIPDHSVLYCDVNLSINLKRNMDMNKSENNASHKHNVSSVPNDFLLNEDIFHKVLEAIQKIENYIEVSSDVQNAYDEFQSLIKCEMDNKLPIYNSSSGNKRKKSRFKPYWNDSLAGQWSKVCETEKKWLRYTGPTSLKQKYKKEYCSERKTFDRLNRKFKRNIKPMNAIYLKINCVKPISVISGNLLVNWVLPTSVNRVFQWQLLMRTVQLIQTETML